MESVEKKTIAILGAGGIGGLVGALLVRAGHEVVFIANPDTAEILRRDGIRVASEQFGDFEVSVDAQDSLTVKADIVLVTVKATQLEKAVERIDPELVEGATLIPFLNGIEHVSDLRRVFPSSRVLAGVIRVESTRVAPGEIEQKSSFVRVDLADESGGDSRRVELVELLQSAGIAATVHDNEAQVMWSKLSFLAPFALLTTRFDKPIGQIRTDHRSELLGVLEEANTVAAAYGVDSDEDEQMSLYDAFPENGTSSMHKDAGAGLPLELEAIGGAVLRAADSASVPAPLTRSLVEEITRQQG